MTPSRPENSSTPAGRQRYVVRQADQFLTVTPPYPDLEAILQTSMIGADDDAEHGYRLRPSRQSLYRPTLAVANAGLAMIASY